jgi:putative tryptophan/tyrosine transport system substrate-binding protein
VKQNILTVALSTILSLSLFHEVWAQQQPSKTLPRIGFISATGTPAVPSPLFEAFRAGLRDSGYLEGKNVLIDRPDAGGRLDKMSALVNEVVQQHVDIIVAVNNVAIRAAKEATKTIPIVIVSSVDPVEADYVDSFARPGRNITGLTTIGRDLSAKRVELLKDVLPKLSRVAVLWDARGPGPKVAFKEYEAATRAFKIGLQSLEVRGPKPDFMAAFQSAKMARAEAVVVVGNPLMAQHGSEVFELAIKNHLATMTEEGRYASAGGLISYGANLSDVYRRAAEYVVEILKGAKPGDLPIKQPAKFETFINLKTSQHLGLIIPQHVLIQADKVIK